VELTNRSGLVALGAMNAEEQQRSARDVTASVVRERAVASERDGAGVGSLRRQRPARQSASAGPDTARLQQPFAAMRMWQSSSIPAGPPFPHNTTALAQRLRVYCCGGGDSGRSLWRTMTAAAMHAPPASVAASTVERARAPRDRRPDGSNVEMIAVRTGPNRERPSKTR